MLKIFTLRKDGFDKSLKVGDSFLSKGNKYIVIKIISCNFQHSRGWLSVEVVAQKTNTTSDFNLYEKFFTLKDIFHEGKNQNGEMSIKKVGEVIQAEGGLAVEITGIESMTYKFVDLIVVYNAELITPWSEWEIDEAIKEERISGFKVISSKTR